MSNKKIKLHRFDNYFFIKESVSKFIKDSEVHVTYLYCLNQSFDRVYPRDINNGRFYLVNEITFVVKHKVILDKAGRVKNIVFNILTPIDIEEQFLILKDVTFSFNRDFIKLLAKKYVSDVLQKV